MHFTGRARRRDGELIVSEFEGTRNQREIGDKMIERKGHGVVTPSWRMLFRVFVVATCHVIPDIRALTPLSPDFGHSIRDGHPGRRPQRAIVLLARIHPSLLKFASFYCCYGCLYWYRRFGRHSTRNLRSITSKPLHGTTPSRRLQTKSCACKRSIRE